MNMKTKLMDRIKEHQNVTNIVIKPVTENAISKVTDDFWDNA